MLKKLIINEKRQRKHFNSIAEMYEKKYGYGDKFTKYKIRKKANKFLSCINSAFQDKKEIKILEIGCGTGVYTVEYASGIPKSKILAIDISGEMIKIAQKKERTRGNIEYKILSAYNTDLNDSSVDVVCGFYILHHLNLTAAIKEISRILKPGGLVYFYEPNILNPVVFIIKSNKFLKKIAGDSRSEWAINPIDIPLLWKGFEILEAQTTEFVWPASFVPFKVKLFFDRLSASLFSKIPGLNLMGGSIEMFLKKNEEK